MGSFFSQVFLPVFESYLYQPGKRRVGKLFPVGDLIGEQLFESMFLYELQYRVNGVADLYQYGSFAIFPASPSTHLLHQLESSFIDPEICEIEDTIRIDHTNQVHMLKIESLYHHLCTYQYIDPLLFK